MNRLTQLIVVSLLLITASCSVYKKANKEFSLGRYQNTIDTYNKVLAKNPDDPEANFFVAESYRKSNRFFESAPYYEKAMLNGMENDSIRLHYAFALKSRGEYEKARAELDKYLKSVDNEEFQARASEEFDNLNYLDELRQKENFFRVKNLSAVNTSAAEYSPIYNDGKLYFTSSRGNNKIYLATGTPFTNIYVAETNGARVDSTSIKSISDLINTNNVNEGSLTFSPDGKTIVFARGNSGKRKGTADVNLFMSILRNGQWTEPRMLNINNPGYWDSSPAFSRDGRTLYFASNRPGGYGGVDLYSARRNARGRFYKVINMGPELNTTGNDMFPYVSDDGHLYFSSDGHPGFGGLDLFVARRTNGVTTVENLGVPINSNADDFGMFLYKADRGFFTSNRDGGEGDDDIYTFLNEDPNLKIVNYYLEGVTMTHDSNDSLQILTGVDVRLLDYSGNELDEATTGDDGKFLFRVYEHEHYNLVAKKTGGKQQYLITRQPFTTVGKSADRDTLTSLVTEVKFDTLLVLEKLEKNKVFVLENIYYDLDRYEIRDDAAAELDKLVTILKDNPEIKIELSSHTDDRQTEQYNLRLSERRAQSAVDYIASQGVDKSRMVARGYGESKLIIQNATTEEEHQVNRRTEFKILEVGRRSDGEDFDEDDYFDDSGN
ncbi:OmpA family protein [Fulvivirga lutea]|uniref:PD40 domain-containing protein n=1 Tax=Fulvivirga lutea TaxID=2810512 RepID=A0A974WJF3_9BACT|nr:OmpA family protein [Fulvivirga lutea]QSE98267.1 PD40 domain-containing protein [Fulvivirga lutea]